MMHLTVTGVTRREMVRAVVTLLSLAIICGVFLFRYGQLSRFTFGFLSEKEFPELTPLDSAQNQLRDAEMGARLKVFFLFSPGINCPACLEEIRTWDRRLASWPSHRVDAALVADGTLTDPAVLRRFARANNFNARILLDPEGQLRRRYRLSQMPLVIGVSENDEVLFHLPLRSGLATEDKDRFIDSLIWESLAP